MSKAFTKEDVDPPERSGRVRSASGLPPGASNYITAAGARRLRERLEKERNAARRVELQRILASVTIVDAVHGDAKEVAFGARVTMRDAEGNLATRRIVGVDELDFEPGGLSWISPDGKALLAAELGGRVLLENGEVATITGIEHPTVRVDEFESAPVRTSQFASTRKNAPSEVDQGTPLSLAVNRVLPPPIKNSRDYVG